MQKAYARGWYLTLQVSALAMIIIFAGMILWASGSGSVLDAIVNIGSTPWGLVTLVDLFMGLAIVALWIGVTERHRPTAIAWIGGLLIFGNLVTLLFIIWRARHGSIRQLLLGPDA